MSKKKFNKVYFEITNGCNYKCPFCISSQRDMHIVDLKFFEKILQDVIPHTQRICLHLLGEPLLHPQFQEILSICKAYNAPIELTTNMSLLSSYPINIFTSQNIKQINFSVQAIISNESIEKQKEVLKHSFKIVQALENSQTFINYRFWAKKDKNLLAFILNQFGYQNLPEDFRLKKKVFIQMQDEFKWPNKNSNPHKEKTFCHGLNSHFGILSSGIVVPCCLDTEGVMSLGNLHHESLDTILNKKEVKDLKQRLKLGKADDPLCIRCSYSDRFQI